MKYKALCITIGSLCLFFSASSVALATNYYISPNGNDNNNGTSSSSPWKTFDYALNDSNNPTRLRAGDTLLVMDGTYYQRIAPSRFRGSQGSPITIKAANDGKAVIDGDTNRDGTPDTIPIFMVQDGYNDYFTFEGLVLLNGGEYINDVGGNIYLDNNATNVIFRRISSYNADKDENTHPISINQSSYILLEDCVAAGTGRKAIIAYKSDHITIRRCFADWRRWDGLETHQAWPWGENIDIYNTTDSIVENSISYGQVPRYGITIRRNTSAELADNNKVLGSIAVYSSIDKLTMQPVDWSSDSPIRPPDKLECCDNPYNTSKRVGLGIFGVDIINNAEIVDFLAYGNAGVGLGMSSGAKLTNSTFKRITLYNNTLEPISGISAGSDLVGSEYSHLTTDGNTISDSYIAKIDGGTPNNNSTRGAGAKYNLLNRHYKDGNLIEGSVWKGQNFGGTTDKWPMEDRARVEYAKYVRHSNNTLVTNFSITAAIKPIVDNAPSGNDNPPPLPTTGPTATPTPTPTTGPTATPSPTPSTKLGEIIPIAVEASPNTQDINPAIHAIDKNLQTRWSAEGIGEWIQFDLGSIQSIGSFQIAWYRGDIRTTTFDILGSVDGQTWSTIQSQVVSSGTTTNFETYQFPTTQIQYLRIVGYGNNVPDSNWNSINEIEIYQGTSNIKYHPKFDLNNDGSVNILDILQIITHIFR